MRLVFKLGLALLALALLLAWGRLAPARLGPSAKGLSGFRVSKLHYDLSPTGMQVTAVRFSISPLDARRAAVAVDGGRLVPCRLDGGRAVCPLRVSAQALDSIQVAVSG